jgi:hypothetical protein
MDLSSRYVFISGVRHGADVQCRVYWFNNPYTGMCNDDLSGIVDRAMSATYDVSYESLVLVNS